MSGMPKFSDLTSPADSNPNTTDASKQENKPAHILTIRELVSSLLEKIQVLEQRVKMLEDSEKAPSDLGIALCPKCPRQEVHITRIKAAHLGIYMSLSCGHHIQYMGSSMIASQVQFDRAR